MKKIIFYTGKIFLFIIFVCVTSIAMASISNNNVGSIATGSNSNSTSILSDNMGSIGSSSNANMVAKRTSADATSGLRGGLFNKRLGVVESNRKPPHYAIVISRGELVSTDYATNTIKIRSVETGLISTYFISNTQMLKVLNERDNVQVFSQAS